jgi:branched-chain amino acid transport system ATP-binding protein
MSDIHLQLDRISAGYGDITVLRDLSLSVRRGEVTAIVGANGAGKTTLLETIGGLIATTSGSIRFEDREIGNTKANRLPGLGLSLVPEGGRLFPFMTVLENLRLGAYHATAQAEARQRIDWVCELFPILRERAGQFAGSLSGGERQMCAVARALMARPRLLMLDEPSVGLSPLMTEKLLDSVVRLARQEELTVIIVEQRVTEVLEIADTAHVLDHGHVKMSAPAIEMKANRQVQEAYMGL